jgi:vitamin B12 transporter
VRMSDAQTGHFDLNLAVPFEQIERIEVLRGAASALYGSDAVGGVINVVTRRGGPALQARLEGGSFGSRTGALAARGALGRLSLNAAAEHGRADGHREGVDYEITQARLAASLPVVGGVLSADLGVGARDFGAAGFYGNFPSAFEETRVATASLAFEPWADARTGLAPRLSWRRHGDDFVLRRQDPAFFHNRHTSGQLGGELVARHRLSDRLRLAGGVEAFRNEIESFRLLPDATRAPALGERSEQRAAAFGELVAGAVGAGVLTAGLRYDHHSIFGGFVAPSLSAAWWPTSTVRLRGSAGRAFRAPTWTERHYRDPVHVASPELDAERSWTADAGVELTPRPQLRLGLGAFVRRTNALIDWARPAGDGTAPWTTRNVTDATFRGLEAEAGATDPLGTRWTAQWTALSVDAQDDAGYESKYALRPLRDTWALGAERGVGAGLTASVRARGARRAGEPAHRLVDARLGYSLGAMRLYLDGQNLGDTRYVDIAGEPAPGRSLLLGVQVGR